MFLKKFNLPNMEDYSGYPFHIFLQKGLYSIDFDEITIFYGDNGSGKSTLINVITEKLNENKKVIERKNEMVKSDYFDTYLESCDYFFEEKIPVGSKLVCSEDIFQNN